VVDVPKSGGVLTASDWHEKFDRFVDHYSRYQSKENTSSVPPDRVFVVDADIGRNVDFKRLSPHHIVLPPQCRTSSPHAESLEEEFVFVVRGNPHLWQNGYLYDLKEGHAVGFPAGTGMAHTLINNSKEDVHLLVAGERTKPDNLCSFPINPELKDGCKIWWEDPPQQALGPHSGRPGKVAESDIGKATPENLIYCPREAPRKPFHYPGDDETFGVGFRISDKVGLKALGIWYERLPPGRRSAFPHAHTHEEEFVFVLKGHPTVWLNGFAKQVAPGFFAAFPANTGIAHVVINDTDDEVIYICIGEAQDFQGEKISYPLNMLRRRECQRKKWDWLDAPHLPQGNAAAVANNDRRDHLAFRPTGENDAALVLEIFRKSPTYFERVDGCAPTLEMARKTISDGPKKSDSQYFKEFLIIEWNDKPIGVLDLHVHHPESGICYLGLLLIVENLFGQGLGSRCYELAEDYIKRALECSTVRLGVSSANDVERFWESMGFVPNGKTYEWAGEMAKTLVRELQKSIR